MIIKHDGIFIKYEAFLGLSEASNLFNQLEENVKYLDGDHSKVFVFNKWHSIPRKHIAYGDEGINYTFSRITVKALPWPDFLVKVKGKIEEHLEETINFALVNRYANGHDYMGEHRDNESTLDPLAPIASLSLGQERPFTFRHVSLVRPPKPDEGSKALPVVEPFSGPKRHEINLRHGSLLTMYPPTNESWYHSLPKRTRLQGVRINITFRRLLV